VATKAAPTLDKSTDPFAKKPGAGKGGNFSVAGSSVTAADSAASFKVIAAMTADVQKEEAQWRAKAAALRDELQTAEGEVQRISNSIPIVVNKYGETAQSIQTRAAALAPYTARVDAARAALAALPEEARKAGASPGWVR
jgi:septal ring factor EnvC (AmiA/AmiB activator)